MEFIGIFDKEVIMKKIRLMILSVCTICLLMFTGCQNQSTTFQKKNSDKSVITKPESKTKLVSITLNTLAGKPIIHFKVPSDWIKQEVGGGSTSGYDWVNPKNSQQKIEFLESGTVGAMQNDKTGQWDITGIFGVREGIKWTNVSSDHLKADFTDLREANKTGYGKAMIVTSVPVAVQLEVWGINAQPILETFHLIQ